MIHYPIIYRSQDGNLRTTLELEQKTAPEWAQLFPLGHFENVPEGGDEDITEVELKQIIANFEKHGSKMLVDADHDFGKAHAWVTAMEIRVGNDDPEFDGLYGKMGWTPAGKKEVEDGEYRYISPSFQKNWIDPKSGNNEGWHCVTASLTNIPYYYMMKELIAASINKRQAGGDPMLEELKKLLGLPAEATDADIKAAVEALFTAVEDVVKVADEVKDKVEPVADAGQSAPSSETIAASLKDRNIKTQMGAVATLLRSAVSQAGEFVAVRNGLQLPQASKSKDILERAKPTGDPEVVSLRSEVAEMKARELQRDGDEIVQRAKAEGRVLASDEKTQKFLREMVEKRGKEETLDYLSTMPVNPALVKRNNGGKLPVNADGVVTLTATQKTTCRSMGIKEEDFQRTLQSAETE